MRLGSGHGLGPSSEEGPCVPDNTPYGLEFINHLRAISKQTYFNYADLQSIKTMSRANLAATLDTECPEFAEIVLGNKPEEAAVRFHERVKQIEGKKALDTMVGMSILDAIVQAFSALG